MIETRTLVPDDWRLWRGLRRAALAEDPAAFGSTLAEWSGPGDIEQRWRARLADIALNVVVLLDGRPAGMVSATAAADDPVELTSMWVAPDARGRGVGDRAVDHVLSWARHWYPGSAVMLSVKADNAHARDLYERHGFVDVGPSPEHPGERRMRA